MIRLGSSRSVGTIAALVISAAAVSGQTPAPPKSSAGLPGPPKMKTIGVVGGIGPQATMEFERQVHRVSQRRLPQFANGGYPPMVVLFHRRPPILLDAYGQPVRPVRLDPVLALWIPLILLSFLIVWMYHVLAHRPGGQPIGALERAFTKAGRAVRSLIPQAGRA